MTIIDGQQQQQEILQLLQVVNSGLGDLKKASAMLGKAFSQPEAIPALLQIIVQAQVSDQADATLGIRQLAAVEVRKLIQKDDGSALWGKLISQVREAIKPKLLEMAINEPSNLVRHSLAHVISATAKIELERGRWKDLVRGLYEFSSSANIRQREVGVYVLYSLFDTIADIMEPELANLMNLFSKTINDQESLSVAITTCQALGKVAEFIEENDKHAVATFQALVPAIVAVLQRCLSLGNEQGVGHLFEVFDELLLLEAPLLDKHFVDLIKLFLQISASTDNSEEVRVQALSFLVWSVMSAKTKISKAKLIPVILQSMFTIAAEEDPETSEGDYPVKIAVQLINTLATTFPPQQVFPEASRLAIAGILSPLPGHRKASMLAVGVLVEGCADFMRNHFKDILQMVILGLNDPAAEVRRAACIALCSLNDDFETEITAEHAQIVPLLFSLIAGDNIALHTEALTTLDVIVESLGSLILPYMDGLMSRLITLWGSKSQNIQISTTNVIGSVAFASSKNFMPYFPQVLSGLSTFINCLEADGISLRAASTDCIGAVASAVGVDVFRPYLQDVMTVVVQGLQIESSPLKNCSYVLCGVLGGLFKEEFTPYLQLIVPPIFHSCQMKEPNEFRQTLDGDDEEDLEADFAGEEIEDYQRNFASGFVQEKQSSIITLGDLFSATKGAFMPFLSESVNMALELLDHYNENVRISATSSLLKFFETMYIMDCGAKQEWESGLPLARNPHENVLHVGKLAMEGILLLLKEEEDRNVVTQCLQMLTETLRVVGPTALVGSFSLSDNPVAIGKHADMIANIILLILREEHPCQGLVDSMDDEDGGEGMDEEDLAELDALVISSAADVIGVCSAALGSQFSPYFEKLSPLLSKFYKKSRPVAERSMAIGALAETVEGLEEGVTPFTKEMMSLFLRALSGDEEEEEVRSNAAFGAGLVIAHSKASNILDYFPRLLTLLHPLFTSSSDLTNARDNACGCLCRMITKSKDNVPLDVAISLLLGNLPLIKDFEENRAVFGAIVGLLNCGNPIILQHLPQVISLFGVVLSTSPATTSSTSTNSNTSGETEMLDQLHVSTRKLIVEFLHNFKRNHQEEFKTIINQLPSDRIVVLETALSSSII